VRYGSGPLQRLKNPGQVGTRSIPTGPKTGGNTGAGDPRPTASSGTRGGASALDPGSARVSLRPNAGYPENTGSLGSGIVGSNYRGYGGVYHSVYNTFGSCYYWGSKWYGGFYNPCYWGAWPFYFACYFPYLYSYYRPYFSTVYVYDEAPAQNTTTVVYVNGAEASGEGVVPEAETGRLPIAAERYLTLGDRAFREGRYTDAVQFYAKAIEYASDQGGLFLVLSDALFAAGDYHYAAYAIRRAFELEPALAQTTVDKRMFYGNPQDFETQLAALEAYLQGHSSDRDARIVLALNYHFSGRSAEAETLLRDGSGLEADPAAIAMLETMKSAVK